jgi:hypothetical protein
MPDTWDPVTYFERAKAWREKAAALPEDDTPCVRLLKDTRGWPASYYSVANWSI